MIRRLAPALAAALLVPTVLLTAPAHAATTTSTAVPSFDHIVTVFLENEDATATFENAKAAPNLAKFEKMGSYVPQYYGAGHASLDNYIAIFSGQQPVSKTEGDCGGMAYSSCLYPATVPTLATTLDQKKISWKSYAEGMNGAVGGHACLHTPVTSTQDIYQGPGTNGYATRHNPPMWFNSVLTKAGNENYCKAHDVDYTQFAKDAASTTTLPRWSFVTPDTCHDGHDSGCTGDPEGPTSASGVSVLDTWLGGFVPSVLKSKGWTSKSLLVITFDEALTTDAKGCTACNDKSAGGRIGALFIGGQVKKSYKSTWNGDHYGLLRTYEQSFGLPTLKSLAATPALKAVVHDGDAGVKPPTDLWVTAAAATPPKAVTPTATPTKKATVTSAAPAPVSSGAGLPTTGLAVGLPVAALVLIGSGALLRFRRPA